MSIFKKNKYDKNGKPANLLSDKYIEDALDGLENMMHYYQQHESDAVDNFVLAYFIEDDLPVLCLETEASIDKYNKIKGSAYIVLSKRWGLIGEDRIKEIAEEFLRAY